MRPQLSRADLLECLAGYGSEEWDKLAEALGYAPRPHVNAIVDVIHLRGDNSRLVIDPDKVFTIPGPTPQARFLRPLSRRRLIPEEAPREEPEWFRQAQALSEDDPEINAPPDAKPPPRIPLMPWPRLWPFLKLALGAALASNRPDLPRVIDTLARGQWLRHLPKASRAGWAGDCQLLLDFAEPLLPFWGDFDELKQRLPPLRGRGGLAILAFPDGDPQGRCWRWHDAAQDWEDIGAYPVPVPGVPVLVLSDLGCNEPAGPRRRRWLRFGAKLKAAGCRAVALMPCPPRRWDAAVARLFQLACWDRAARLPRHLGRAAASWRRDEEALTQPSPSGRGLDNAEPLLALLSPAIRVEPALLRAARCRLPAGLADVGTEASAWNHPDVHATLTAFYYEKDSDAYRSRFQTEFDAAQRAAIVGLTMAHHAHLSPVILHEEAAVLAELLGPDEWGAVLERLADTPAAGVLQAHGLLQRRLAKTSADGGGNLAGAVRSWIGRVGERCPPADVWRNNEGLESAWVLAHCEALSRGSVAIPPGLSPQRVAWAMGGKREARAWRLCQTGAELVAMAMPSAESFSPLPAGEGPGVNAVEISRYSGMDRRNPDCMDAYNPRRPWSLGSGDPCRNDEENLNSTALGPGVGATPTIAVLEAAAPYLTLVSEDATPSCLLPLDRPIPLLAETGFHLRSDHEEWGFDWIVKPDWAIAIGRDRLGLFVEAVWLDTRHRLDWQMPTEDQAGFWRGDGPLGVDDVGLFADLEISNAVQRFRWIAPGRFLMGSPETEPERWSERETQHEVTLTCGYWLADSACTLALWQAVTGENPSHFKDDGNNPVENVSWDQVQGFIQQLNGMIPGLDARLPTEAEWEYACRAETTTPFSFGGNITPEQVNYHGGFPYAGGAKGLYRGKTVPVKSLPPNPWGLNEMHGNVWEWCEDWFAEYETGPQTDPEGPATGAYRVLRGGSWFNYGGNVRSASRLSYVPDYRYQYIGFRLALSQTGSQVGRNKPV